MKLLRLRLHEQYRSLDFDQQSFPKLELIKNEIDPICLVGLNGSGKSNLLELVADIFYKVETDLLNYQVASKQKPYIPYSDNRQKKKYILRLTTPLNTRVKPISLELNGFQKQNYRASFCLRMMNTWT
ncbi:AAA family ATPase [Pedobacter panaciterrae]